MLLRCTDPALDRKSRGDTPGTTFTSVDFFIRSCRARGKRPGDLEQRSDGTWHNEHGRVLEPVVRIVIDDALHPWWAASGEHEQDAPREWRKRPPGDGDVIMTPQAADKLARWAASFPEWVVAPQPFRVVR